MRWSSVFSPTLSLSIFLCASLSQLHSVLSCILSPFFFFLLSLIFPPSFLRPCWALIGLLGIKPGALTKRGTFGSKMARGTVATYLHGVLLLALWKPSLQGGGSPLLHVCSIQLCSTCGSGVRLSLCCSVGRRGKHELRSSFLHWLLSASSMRYFVVRHFVSCSNYDNDNDYGDNKAV